MNLKLVKTAPGCRLRHPATGKVMANADVDPDRPPHKVDLDDPHWYRAWARGDIVEVDPPAAVVSPAETVPAPPVSPVVLDPAPVVGIAAAPHEEDASA